MHTIPADIDAALASWGIALTDEMRRRLCDLYDLLQAANAKTNLTRITSAEDYWVRHVCDSLAVLREVPALTCESLRVADVGCGGGFPILPLLIVCANLHICGIECRPRKSAFIQSALASLDLPHGSVFTAQAREAGRGADHAGRYDYVLMRAVGPTGRMLKEVRHLPAPTGAIVQYKTPESIETERTETLREAAKFDLTPTETAPFTLPDGAPRAFVILVRRLPRNDT